MKALPDAKSTDIHVTKYGRLIPYCAYTEQG